MIKEIVDNLKLVIVTNANSSSKHCRITLHIVYHEYTTFSHIQHNELPIAESVIIMFHNHQIFFHTQECFVQVLNECCMC